MFINKIYWKARTTTTLSIAPSSVSNVEINFMSQGLIVTFEQKITTPAPIWQHITVTSQWEKKRCGCCSLSPWRSCRVTVMVMLYIIYLIRAGIIYLTWLCCQWESVDVYFSWPENTLKQTADRAVILDSLLLSYFWQNCIEVVS